MSTIAEAYTSIEGALTAKRAPATSRPFLDALATFWASGKVRMVVRKGRQVGWSTIVCPRVATATALSDAFVQSRGSRGTIGLFSTRQKEADERLWNLERTFFDLGIKVKVRGDTLEIPNRPVIIQSFPATSEVARGTNLWMAWEDEMPAWRDGDGANPAHERDAAIIPAGASHANFRVYSGGTPLGNRDFHAQLVDLGETEAQCVFSGPSWYWRPELTQDRCRQLQPDQRLFDREFAAIPSEGTSIAIPQDDTDAMVRPVDERAVPVGPPVLFLDTSAGKGDAFSYCVAGFIAEGGMRRLHISFMGAFEGKFATTLTFDAVVSAIARRVRPLGVFRGFADQYMYYAIESAFSSNGIAMAERSWTAPTKVEGVSALRRLLRDRVIVIEPGVEADALKRDLAMLEETILPSGAISVRARRNATGHADRGSLLLLIARCESEGDLIGSSLMTRSLGAARFAPIAARWDAPDFISPRDDPAPRIPSPTNVVIPGGPGQQPSTFTIPASPAAPRVGGGQMHTFPTGGRRGGGWVF